MLGRIFKMAPVFRRNVVYILIYFVFVTVCLSTDDVNYCKTYNNRCTCTDTSVVCRDAGIRYISDIYQFVTENVTHVSITGNDFFEIPKYFLAACEKGAAGLENLQYVDLSDNNIINIHRFSFGCLPNLRTLKLAHNQWNIDGFQSDYFSPLTKLSNLDLQDAFTDTVVANQIHALLTDGQVTGLETLDLSDNGLTDLSYDFGSILCDAVPLVSLNLSHNNLSEPHIRECWTNIQTLDLSSNLIQTFTPQFMDVIEGMMNLKTVILDKNPYRCDCSLTDTYDWLTTTVQPVNKANLICHTGFNDSYIGKPILSLKDSDLQCEEPRIIICYGPDGNPVALARSTIMYILIAAVVLVGAVVVGLVVVVRRRRWAARQYNKKHVQTNGNDGSTYTRMV